MTTRKTHAAIPFSGGNIMNVTRDRFRFLPCNHGCPIIRSKDASFLGLAIFLLMIFGWLYSDGVQAFELSINGYPFIRMKTEDLRVYQLQTSEDLKQWQDIGDPFLPIGEKYVFLPEGKAVFARLLPRYKAIEKPLRIVIVGESTAADFSWYSTVLSGWGQVLPDFFQQNVRIVNMADAAVGTVEFFNPNRLLQFLSSAPDIVLIQFGQNDYRRSLSETEYRLRLKVIVEMTRSLGAVPILISPPAYRIFGQGDWVIPLLDDYARYTQSAALELHVDHVNLHAKCLNLFQRHGNRETAFISFCGNECDDRAHFSRAGAYVIASLIVADLPLLLQVYRQPLNLVTDKVKAALASDRAHPGLEIPFQDLTGFREDEIWSWVYP